VEFYEQFWESGECKCISLPDSCWRVCTEQENGAVEVSM